MEETRTREYVQQAETQGPNQATNINDIMRYLVNMTSQMEQNNKKFEGNKMEENDKKGENKIHATNITRAR